jgi:2-phosphosulfolactate phosphatase
VSVQAQERWDIRCEWGALGLAALAPASDVVVIVDVLSFSTCVEIAVARQAEVFPYLWGDERAVGFANGIMGGPGSGRSFMAAIDDVLVALEVVESEAGHRKEPS